LRGFQQGNSAQVLGVLELEEVVDMSHKDAHQRGEGAARDYNDAKETRLQPFHTTYKWKMNSKAARTQGRYMALNLVPNQKLTVTSLFS